jgi:hypothetical protein
MLQRNNRVFRCSACRMLRRSALVGNGNLQLPTRCVGHGGEVLQEICRFPSACVSVQGSCGTATKNSGGKRRNERRRNERRRKLSGCQCSKVSSTTSTTYSPQVCLMCMESPLMVPGHQSDKVLPALSAMPRHACLSETISRIRIAYCVKIVYKYASDTHILFIA